jgi:lysophospholipase
MKSILTSLILGLLSFRAYAVNEAGLATDFHAKILPFMARRGIHGHFTGAGGLNIEYLKVVAKDPKGVLVISPGRGESYMKYSEVIYDLQDLGYTIYAIDHRGQGYSDRMLADPIKSHVEHFQDYVDDFSTFVLTIVKPGNYKKSFLLSHSMGSAIGAGFLREYPYAFTGAIMVTPMFEINTDFLSQSASVFLAKTFELLDLGDIYAPGQKPYNPNSPFAGNIDTYSEARFNMNRDLLNTYPQLRLGGSTVRWVQESLYYTKPLRETDHLLRVPTLMFQASDDHYVLPQGETEVCHVMSPNFCKLIYMPTSQHEILQEQDVVRDAAFKAIRDFINSDSYAQLGN